MMISQRPDATPLRTAALAFLLVILAGLPLGAQTNPPATTSSNSAGMAKIVSGLILIGAGAIVIPATNAGGRSQRATWTVGEGMVGAGVVCFALGARDRRRATSPELTVGVTARHGVGGIVVRRTW